MNYNKIIYGIGIVASLFTIQACDKIKDFKDLNVNPNLTTSPIPSALLTNVESNLGAHRYLMRVELIPARAYTRNILRNAVYGGLPI